MDLNAVEALSVPRRRTDIWPLGPGDAVLAGGTWLFSEPQPHLRRLVDITQLGWEPAVVSTNGIDLSATCTLERLAQLSTQLPVEWTAAPLLRQCCAALLASYKIWHTATVGGNLCLSLPAGAIISLATALDGQVTVWRPDGGEYRLTLRDFVTGVGQNTLAPGEVLRAVHLPAAALRARTAMRKLAFAPLGRSGVVVIGRRDTAADGGGFALSVTAATVRPYVFAFPSLPSVADVTAAHSGIPEDAWLADAHGDPDWRSAMTLLLAQQVRSELT